MSKGPKNVITKVDTSPWKPQQPYLRDVFRHAQDAYDSGAGAVAPMNPAMLGGLNMIAGRALSGSPLNASNNAMLQETLEGGFLGANPYLDAMYDRAAGRVADHFSGVVNPQITGAFSGAGRLGSGAYAAARNRSDQALGDQLTRLATDLYGGQYQQERERMMQASALAPGAAAGDYADGQAMLGVGQTIQGQHQAENDEAWRRLSQYLSMVGGNYGSTQTSTQPVFQNPLGQILGTALTLGSTFFGGPVAGTAANAVTSNLFKSGLY